MVFESQVINKIAPFLDYNERAEFTCGSLFVECSEKTARSVFHKLCEDAGLGKVKISKTPIEYVFDFVA
jgi:hypothetical protein